VRTLYISEWYFGCSAQSQLHCDLLLLVFYSSPPFNVALQLMSSDFFLLDRSTQEILAQHASAAAQYNSTLHKLTQINTTVNYLLDVLEKTRHVGICGHIHFVFVISF